MSRANGKFDFKRFSVAHCNSSMKVGVDGVLVALWSDMPAKGSILDVGCGCGVIALICAQRTETTCCNDTTASSEPFASGSLSQLYSEDIIVDAIDIDEDSVDEARKNFKDSPWNKRLNVLQTDFNTFSSQCKKKYSLIISNPPYFFSGVDASSSRRLAARHQGSLSPSVLIKASPSLLMSRGILSMVVPSEFAPALIDEACTLGLSLMHETLVCGHVDAPPKRALLQFINARNYGKTACDTLVLEISPGIPTPEYRKLGTSFYLKF